MVPGLEKLGKINWPLNLVELQLLVMVDGTWELLLCPPGNSEVDTFLRSRGFSIILLVIGELWR